MFWTPDLGVDIGNSKVSICVKGEGVVTSVPSYLAYRGGQLEESSVIAFGDEAKSMFERSHPGITVMTPMASGVVVDSHAAGILLKKIAHQAGLTRRLTKPRIVVGVLFGSSDIERKAFINVGESLGCRKVHVVDEPLAAAISNDVAISEPYANMILDIGDGATEGLIVSQKRTILGSSMRFGGGDVDTLIVEFIRKYQNLKISISQARNIKVAVAESGCLDDSTFITVKGIDCSSRLPCERQVEVKSLSAVFDKFANRVVGFVLNLLSRVPPEVSVDLIENGIHLCGGASQSLLIKEKLIEATNLKVNLAEDPHHAVIAGIYRMLDFARYFD